MVQYQRKWPCSVCGKPLIYDTETKTVSCGCGTVSLPPLPKKILDFLQNFEKIEEPPP